MNRNGVVLALISAALFGVSTPAAKFLLGSIDPAILAGLLYCGAGAGIAILRRFALPLIASKDAAETPLVSADVPWLAGAIVAGGIAGPLLLMAGLARTDAAAASLLLTLEGVATALLAWFVFHENFDRRIALGMLCLVAGAVVLSWAGQPSTRASKCQGVSHAKGTKVSSASIKPAAEEGETKEPRVGPRGSALL